MLRITLTIYFIQQHVLADCYVVRTSELGMTDEYIHCRTHLGHLLNEGDSVLGLDVANSNINNPEMDNLKGVLPDVVSFILELCLILSDLERILEFRNMIGHTFLIY